MGLSAGTPLSVRTADGFELSATRFDAVNAGGTALIAGAMAVPQDFYAPFARFLAESGIHATTFDYRGMGRAPRVGVKAVDTDVARWAEQDLAAMLIEARKPSHDVPLVFVGHSLGGQLVGVTPGNEAIAASVHVAAGSGYYKFNDRMPVLVRALWFVYMPLFTPLFGYFPGKMLRAVGDLPRGVTWQWRRWCLHPEYLLSEPGYAERYAGFRAPILSYSFEDDDINTKNGIDHLHASYPKVTRRHVQPRDVGQPRIGHFGFFNERCREPLWNDALAWLKAGARYPPESTTQ